VELKQSTHNFVWLKAISEATTGRMPCQGLEGLEAHFSIVVLNDDKDIVERQKLDSFHLAEMISDASPYLILIPKSQGSFMISASSQYQNLCLLEDLRCLQSGAIGETVTRLSWIQPLAASRHGGTFATVLEMLRIENEYNLPKQFEICTIDRILMDEAKQVNLRDLPSFLFCCQSMAAQMKNQLAPSNKKYVANLLKQAFSHVHHTLRQQGIPCSDHLSEVESILAQPTLTSDSICEVCDWVIANSTLVFRSLDVV
jgi:hypothetical protein